MELGMISNYLILRCCWLIRKAFCSGIMQVQIIKFDHQPGRLKI